MFGRVRNQLIDQKNRWNCAVCADDNSIFSADIDLATRQRFTEVFAYVAQIRAQVERVYLRAAIQTLMSASDRSYPGGRFAKLVLNVRAFCDRSMEVQHGGDHLKTIVYPMVDLFDEQLLAIQGHTETRFDALPLDCHA